MYNLLISIVFLILFPYVLVKISYCRTRKGWLERLGFVGDITPGSYIWVHCASVGEVKTIQGFIHNLSSSLSEYKFILSVITPAGKNVADKLNLPLEKIFFLPFDHPLIIRNVLRCIRPAMLILVETELWPNLIHYAKLYGARIMLVNGRISLRSYRIYRIFEYFLSGVLSKVDLFLMREKIDSERIINLGAKKNNVVVTGNMKYDQMIGGGQPASEGPALPGRPTRRDFVEDLSAELNRAEYGFNEEDKIFVAGSIREGEEKIVIDAYGIAREKVPGLKFIVAPRHLNRINIVEDILRKENISYSLKTAVTSDSHEPFDCLILDTYGELIKIYSIADVIFVGGSLVLTGGQNILEPAGLGKAVLFGPYMESFHEPAVLLKESGGGIEVKNVNELAESVVYLVKNEQVAKEKGEKARTAVSQMAGVTERNVRATLDLLNSPGIKNILIIQPSRIGDVVFTLPALASLKKLYPDSYTAWLVDDRCAELLKGNRYLDEVITFPFIRLKEDIKRFKLAGVLKEILKLKKLLREKKFDLTIDFHGLAKSAFIVLLAGGKYRLGSSSSYGMKEMSWLFSKEVKPAVEHEHCTERHLEVIKFLGGKVSKEFNIDFSEADKKHVNDILSELRIKPDSIAVVFPGGGWKSRRWFPERFARLADNLISEYKFDAVFIGGKAGGSPEKGIIDNIMSSMKHKSHDLSGKLSLKQLVALIFQAKLFVGNEAGPMHIACALGVPVVAIVGPTNPGRTGPFGGRFTIVRKEVACGPCRERNCRKMDCMKLIEVKDVMEAVRKTLLGDQGRPYA